MITYTFKILKHHKNFPESWKDFEIGSIVEVDLNIKDYDAFKKKYDGYLERYLEEAPAFAIVDMVGKRGPDGLFMEKLARIRNNYPGAKDMFKDARWQPKREW